MKKIILFLFVMSIMKSVDAAIVCYTGYGNDCFYTRYTCGEIGTRCSQNCTCVEFSFPRDVLNSNIYKFIISESGRLLVGIEGEQYRTLDNLTNSLGEDEVIGDVIFNNINNTLVYKVYDSVELGKGSSKEESYLRTISIANPL